MMVTSDILKVSNDDSHISVIGSRHRRTALPPGRLGHPHRHPFFSIELICGGKANHYINGNYYEGSAGSVFLFSPFDAHFYDYVDDSELELQSLYFSEDILPPEILEALDVDNMPVAGKFTKEEFNTVKELFAQLHSEFEGENPYRTSLLQNLASRVIIMTLRSGEHRQKNAATSNVQKAILYIRRHFRENITLNEVSEHFYITPNHFCKYFKKHTGTTFKNYLISLRLDYALSLIQSSKKSITEICLESGFSSPSYFSKIFTQKFGKSPSEYR